MSELIKFQLEYPIHSSINILYKRLSTPSGLSEWFADDVHIRDNVYTFYWDGSEHLSGDADELEALCYSRRGAGQFVCSIADFRRGEAR